MAILTSSTKSDAREGNIHAHGHIYADYTTTQSDTNLTVSGTLYLKGWKTSSIGYGYWAAVTSSLSSISVSNGVVSSSFTEQTATLDINVSENTKTIGTFSVTIPRLTIQQSVSLSIGSTLTVEVTHNNSYTGKVNGSVALTVPALQGYQVTYYNNDGTGTSQTQTKYYGIDLTLSPSQPTFAGYTFLGWATSAANAAAGTVAYYGGETYSTNAALNLYAVWELTYALPTITNLTVERCNSSGTLDDEGTYSLVSFSWSVFQSASARYYGGNTYPYSSNSAACSITVGSVTVTPALSGSSGTETIKVGSGSFSVDTQYSASVTITDTQSIVSPHSQTVSGALPTSSFPMDINSDGSAVAFLRPAPDNGSGVYVGGDVNLNSGKHYKINGTNLAASDVGAVPVMAGVIQMFAGTTAPTGWLICDGSPISRTDYATLFSVIGTTYGTGDGSTTFNLPDLRGRVAVGVGTGTASDATAHALGQYDGAETVTLTENEIPSHTHGNKSLTGEAKPYTDVGLFSGQGNGTGIFSKGSSSLGAYRLQWQSNAGGSYSLKVNASHEHNSFGGGNAHKNMQPYLAINYIIATGKTS